MLILTRKTGQGFTIGDDIEITITEVSGDKVRVGINAPKQVKILRSELTETVEQNVKAAAGPAAGSLRALAKGLQKVHPAPPKPDDGAGAKEAGAKEKE
ncbi:carbon storage regulator CsrA [Ruminococcaceae bacterium OttesenSCG-928-A11]|nr:carbon storage regulator CsrA [Ruminococcaceae bacterium OttesenSCG-928-A11]